MDNIEFDSARVAAEWWANALKGHAKQDAGLENPMAELLLLLCSSLHMPNEKNITNFQTLLEEELNNRLNAMDDDGSITLSVDYGAEGILADIAERAKISNGTGSAFPVKTMMWVKKNSVVLANGYQANPQTIYLGTTESKDYKQGL